MTVLPDPPLSVLCASTLRASSPLPQFALSAARKLAAGGGAHGRRVHVVVPDADELTRSTKIVGPGMAMWDESDRVTLGCLTGDPPGAGLVNGWLGGVIKPLQGKVEIKDDGANSAADLHLILNVSTAELPVVRSYCETVALGKPVVLWNCELDTLRADLGLFSLPPKSLQYDFLSTFRPVFYVRQRDYSKTVAVAPYIVNYSGALLREWPGPWQVLLRQDNGDLACVAERSGEGSRYLLQDVKDELMLAMGLLTEEENSDSYRIRQGFKRYTWWEGDEGREAEQSKKWRS